MELVVQLAALVAGRATVQLQAAYVAVMMEDSVYLARNVVKAEAALQ